MNRMAFTSATFLLLFFPVCVLVNYLMGEKYRNIFLCAMSVLFYSWCGIRFLLLIVISATLAYLFGIAIEGANGDKRRKFLLVLGISIQLASLFYYKYFFDLMSVITPWLPTVFMSEKLFTPESIALPLGISFYTFSILSYLLDTYWGICNAQKKISLVYLYVLFFPKVVQGPIMRYKDFESQLQNRTVNLESLNVGLERFIKGMVKKTLIADQLQGLVTYCFSNIDGVGTIPAWIGIISYIFQLYYDFSGYSDMAIGLGTMLGFSLPENFDHPYMSDSVAEYWRRWHISLGAWFKDYVYTPCLRTLTGTKWSKKLKNPFVVCDVIALIITWTLTGVWHGSGLNFLMYGLWFCLFIIIERLQTNRRKRLKKIGKLSSSKRSAGQKVIGHFVTLFAVIFGLVLFKADSLQTAGKYISKLFVWSAEDGLLFFHQLDNYLVFILIIALVFVFPVYEKVRKKLTQLCSGTWAEPVFLLLYKLTLLAAFFVAFCYSVSDGYAAFLYEVF